LRNFEEKFYKCRGRRRKGKRQRNLADLEVKKIVPIT
jgi:hypothetical protein